MAPCDTLEDDALVKTRSEAREEWFRHAPQMHCGNEVPYHDVSKKIEGTSTVSASFAQVKR